jgi:hypothetical protein
MAALYGPEYPPHYAFDILTGSMPNPSYDPNESRDNSEQILAVTRAIVYTDKHYRNWDIAKTGQGEWQTPSRSLEEFVKELRAEFGNVAGEFIITASPLPKQMRKQQIWT